MCCMLLCHLQFFLSALYDFILKLFYDEGKQNTVTRKKLQKEPITDPITILLISTALLSILFFPLSFITSSLCARLKMKHRTAVNKRIYMGNSFT